MSEIKFKPLGVNVLIFAPPIELKTKGGILKGPKQLEEERVEWLKKNDFFKVAAVGEGVTTVKAGDSVMLAPANSSIFTIDGVEYFITYAHNILGVKIE